MLAAMRALRIHEFGGPEVLRVEDVPDPAPGPGEVVLRVTASALNHLDVDIRHGVSRFPVPFPHTPGFEVVGRVHAVGEGVTGWAEGDRALCFFAGFCGRCRFCRTGREPLCNDLQFVSVAIPGGMSELFRCPADQLLPLPDALDDAHAAAVMAAFGTSYHMLFTRACLRAGERVLITSVSAGIASAAVQLARWAGATVIGTSSSPEKLEQARALGLDHGIDYTAADVVEEVLRLTDGEGVDLAYEHVGGARFAEALGSIGKDGRVVTCGAHAGEVVDFDIVPFFRGQKTVIGSFCYTREEVAACLELAAQGKVRPLVHSTFGLEDARAAYELMEARAHVGKIVVTP
jgi:NADPH:quinone reductase-like Zn-dependent oxidoreductase